MTYDEQVKNNFDLLCEIIKQDKNTQMRVDLSNIDEIINKKIPETLKKNAPADFYDLYIDFKAEYERFRDFILYDKLIGKNIVALGGGFSSGKSSFLNALMGQNALPSGIEPSTSIPTYIVHGEKHELIGTNIFDTKVEIKDVRDIKKIAHGFGDVKDSDDNKITGSITLGHVLDNLFFSTPKHEYENIAFLDTPGYSKPDSEEYSTKTDEQIARIQLNSSNYILWFVQADAGTITDADIDFIKGLREDIPLMVILNKADKKTVDDLKEIIEKIKFTLNIKGVRYVDVFAFTNKTDDIHDDKAFIEKNIESIKKQIEKWNEQKYEANFARSFKKIFVRCKEFYESEIDEEQRKLKILNDINLKLSIEDDIEEEIPESLKLMSRLCEENVIETKELKEKLEQLKNDFFKEIKYVADMVYIDMPEPSEIDLIEEESIIDVLKILQEYKKEKGIQTDRSMIDMLKKSFLGIEPVINKVIGGSEHRDELIDVIKTTYSE